jgi:putative ABC transport system permease protein
LTLRDLKVALRHLLKSPGFALMAVLMLALGIGAATAIFSLVEGVLLRPLPFPEPDRLVNITDVMSGPGITGNGEEGVTAVDIHNYRQNTHSFVNMGAYQTISYQLTDGEPEQVNTARIEPAALAALGAQPLLGRWFTQAEDDQKATVAILGYELWHGRFHDDRQIVGKTISLDRRAYTVVGVMPRSFEFPLIPGRVDRVRMWVPMRLSKIEIQYGAASWQYFLVARLKPGVTTAQATADAEVVAEQTVRENAAAMKGFTLHPAVRSLMEETVETARPLVRTLFFAVMVVLLIACANLAGLLLVRALRRQRETAVRLALGASAATLLSQALAESLLLSITGGLLGLAFAAVIVRAGAAMLPGTMPRIDEIHLDGRIAAFALLLAVLTGVICGLVPAFAAMRTRVNESLKEGGRTGTVGGGHAWLRSTLVVAEIAVAIILLTSAGLLLRSFEKMRQVELGVRPENVLTGYYALPYKAYGTQSLIDGFNNELLRRLRQVPGVKSVGLTSYMPLAGAYNNSATFIADGYVPPKGTMNIGAPTQVQGDYFQAMGVPLLRGRYLNDSDTATTQLVTVVNRKLAEQDWPGQDPIGKRLKLGTGEMASKWLTVVGEVEDVKEKSPESETPQQFYQAIDQVIPAAGSLAQPDSIYGNAGFVVLRSAMAPELLENTLRATVRSIDPRLPLSYVQTMEQTIADSTSERRFNTVILVAFAAAAVLLAVLGVYSVIAFSVVLRMQEMAIRIAMGSRRSGILRLVVVSGVKLAAAGCVLGLLGAVGVSKLLQSLLFGVSPFDPIVLGLSALVVLLLAVAASFFPARKAADADPMHVLRG